MKKNQQFVDIENARLDEQKQVMQKIMAEGHCPFCEENLRTYHKKPFLMEGKFWIVTENQWPYEFTKLHLLAIYKKHAETLGGVDPAAGEELFRLFTELAKKYEVHGGAIAIRFGDTNYSAGTVNHIHAQFIMPDIAASGFQPVRIKIGKTPRA